MADIVSRERRSQMMSGIRRSDTTPELLVRSALHKAGFRFRLSSGASLPGRPDVVLPKYRMAVFVHGCFWHRHEGCRLAYTPKSNRPFWRRKLRENVERDARKARELRHMGWRRVVVWECDISPVKLESLARRIRSRLAP